MDIRLTYDYELFFGNITGSIDKCIIEPTNELRKIAHKTGIKMVFFVDVGYIKQLHAHIQYPQIKEDYELITHQIKTLVEEGHDCQLHIHPHWEDSYYDGEKWVMNVSRYKLADFSKSDIEKIVLEYQSILFRLTNKPVIAYRAGGWCLQPFSKVKETFKKAGLIIDSTVFIGGKNTKPPYHYDFKNCPDSAHWKFSDDLCVENKAGEFTEYPISSMKYTAIFFWRLFVLGRLFPSRHKPIGNGYPVASKGMRKEMLTKGKLLPASSDGYFVTKLDHICSRNQKKGFNNTTIIGHPKAMTRYSLKYLEKVIIQMQKKGHSFRTFR